MKVRIGFVSNSSSSSYVIAYDACFFGNLKSLFEDCYAGCDTKCLDSEHMDEFYRIYCDTDEERAEFKKKVEEKKKEGKQVVCLNLDNDFGIVMTMMKMINESNGGNKLEFLFQIEDD